MSNKEIHRCLKRYIVRELHLLILADLADSTRATLHRSVIAPTESLWSSLRKHACMVDTSRRGARRWMKWSLAQFLQCTPLHSTLDHVSPMTFEKNWAAAQRGDAA
jgi:hypothetical protein